jgi:hypothetical protein
MGQERLRVVGQASGFPFSAPVSDLNDVISVRELDSGFRAALF